MFLWGKSKTSPETVAENRLRTCYRRAILKFLRIEYVATYEQLKTFILRQCDGEFKAGLFSAVLYALEKKDRIRKCDDCKKYFLIF